MVITLRVIGFVILFKSQSYDFFLIRSHKKEAVQKVKKTGELTFGAASITYCDAKLIL
jgi:hypothetical protein